MVPPEGIDKIAPTTLPADFGEWDSGDNAEAKPVDFNGFDRFPGSVAAPKATTKSATSRVAVLPADRPSSAPPRKQPKRYQEAEPAFELPKSKAVDLDSLEQADENKGKRTKVLIGAVAVAVLLVGGSVGYLKMSSKPATTNQPVASQTLSTTAASNAPVPAAGTTSSAPVTPTTTAAEETPAPEPGLGKQSELMNRQLNAPSRISGDLKAMGANQAAPTSGFGAAGMDGMGGAAPVLSSGNGPKVKVEAQKKVSISAGVAVGLLTQKTAPTYPPIARNARISGTVVIQATISKTGAVENTRVVSGPTMLRQAALDAVRSWRYRPYLLDGQPVEVDTTVNVVFTLGG